jgi:hypothetical protein
MVSSLLLLLLIGIAKATFLRYFDILFVIDLITATLLLLLTALRWGLRVVDRESFRISRTAMLALAVTILLTQAVPQTIIEVTGFNRELYKLSNERAWYHLGDPLPKPDLRLMSLGEDAGCIPKAGSSR